jgi:hypothetical protein
MFQKRGERDNLKINKNFGTICFNRFIKRKSLIIAKIKEKVTDDVIFRKFPQLQNYLYYFNNSKLHRKRSSFDSNKK